MMWLFEMVVVLKMGEKIIGCFVLENRWFDGTLTGVAHRWLVHVIYLSGLGCQAHPSIEIPQEEISFFLSSWVDLCCIHFKFACTNSLVTICYLATPTYSCHRLAIQHIFYHFIKFNPKASKILQNVAWNDRTRELDQAGIDATLMSQNNYACDM